MTRWLSHNISFLIPTLNPQHLQNTIINLFINIMKLSCHMVRFLRQVKINCHLDCRRVIAKYRRFQPRTSQFFNHIDHPDCLSRRRSQCHILCMAGRRGYTRLTPGHPSNWVAKEKYDISMRRSRTFTPPVRVAEHLKIVVEIVAFEPNTLVLCR